MVWGRLLRSFRLQLVVSYLDSLGTAWPPVKLPGLWMKGRTPECALGIRVWSVRQLSWDAGHSPVLPTYQDYTWTFALFQSCEKGMASERMMR